MKVLKAVGKALSLTLTILIAVVLLCNIYTIAARYIGGEQQPDIFGWSTAVVISGSMSGSIEVNDMVIIHRQDSYAVGDVVTFKSGSSIVTHRIIGEENGLFVTKGDANNTRDTDPLNPELIVGRVVKVIPGIGKGIEFMRSPLGLTCIVFVGFSLYWVPTLFEERK
jgi:signal peptidase